MAGQCWALIVLKLRLMRAMWTGVHTFSLIVTVLMVIALTLLAAAASVGLFFLGWKGMPAQQPDPLRALGVLDALALFYLFFWAWGLLMELQRSDVIDLRKLLFLPVSPRMVFVLNFVASLFGPAMIFFVPASLALLGGLTLRHGWAVMAWGVPLAAGFFLMLGAWAFLVRGWLAVLMEDKRRRRLILTVLPIIFILIGQAPGIISASLQNMNATPGAASALRENVLDDALLTVNRAFPPAWFPYGIWSITRGDYGAATASVIGCFATAALGLLLGYNATLRYYRGGSGGKVRVEKARPLRRPLTARRWPLLDGDTAALAGASFLSYLRHPNIRMLLIMPVCMGFLIVFMYRSGAYGAGAFAAGKTSEWAPIIVLVWPFFNFSYVLFNIFGIDRESFRGLVLLPTARYKYLLAKNLALFPFVGGMSIAFVLGGALLLNMSVGVTAVAALQVVQLFVVYTIIGNIASIYLPHHIGWNGVRGGNSRVLMMCVGILSALMLGLLMLPTAICLFIDEIVRELWGYSGMSLGIPVSAGLLAVTFSVYFFSLRFAGDLLYDRETRILDRLVRDRE
jgi:ABC-2 type transport system permease protein